MRPHVIRKWFRKRTYALLAPFFLIAALTLGLAPTASANNCTTVVAGLPGTTSHPGSPTVLQGPVTLQCDAQARFRWYDTMYFAGGANGMWYSPDAGIYGASYPPGGGTAGGFLAYSQYACNTGWYVWWWHTFTYEVQWGGNGAWGPPHTSAPSDRWAGTC